MLASGASNPLDTDEPIRIIADLQDWALWSTRAAETAKQMSLSAQTIRAAGHRMSDSAVS